MPKEDRGELSVRSCRPAVTVTELVRLGLNIIIIESPIECKANASRCIVKLMPSARVRLGELLVEAQVITREQLAEMLEFQKQDGRRLGTLMVESGLVTEVQVTQVLSQQLSIPWVSLYHIDFSRQLLDLVPREVAEQYGLVPIFVRRVRGLGNALYIAMDDRRATRPRSRRLRSTRGCPFAA